MPVLSLYTLEIIRVLSLPRNSTNLWLSFFDIVHYSFAKQNALEMENTSKSEGLVKGKKALYLPVLRGFWDKYCCVFLCHCILHFKK